jgi:hypothetical protein
MEYANPVMLSAERVLDPLSLAQVACQGFYSTTILVSLNAHKNMQSNLGNAIMLAFNAQPISLLMKISLFVFQH